MPAKVSIGSWAFCVGPYHDQPIDFHTVVHKLQHLGFDGVELCGFPPYPTPYSHPTKASREKLRKSLASHDLAVSGLAADLWKCPIISTPDSGPFVAEFARNLTFAEDLGIETIRVDSVEGPDIFEQTGTDRKVGRDRLVKAFDLCAKLAADRGVTVAWEFEPGFAFHAPAEVVEMTDAVRALGNPNFGVLFDTVNAHVCAKDALPGGALELLTQLQGKVAHVHLADSDNTINELKLATHAPFGKGVLNFDELIPAILAANPMSGWWCVDLAFCPDAWDATPEVKHFLDAMRQKYPT